MSSPTKMHKAIITPGPRLPLEVAQYPTQSPGPDEVLIKVQWTSSSPLYLHQADGGLLITPPTILGSSSSGLVVETGNQVRHLQVGDEVFGFSPIQETRQKAHQEYVTSPAWCFGKVPPNMTPEAAVSVPDNLVTIFNLMSADLSLPVPWPKPANYVPEDADVPILIWGAASSCGQYALQLLRYYGYKRLVGVASPKHHEYLMQDLGAETCYGYSDLPGTVEALRRDYGQEGFKYVIDCIGSQEKSVKPICETMGGGGKDGNSTVAILLPVITKEHGLEEKPEFSMHVEECAEWGERVVAKGVRTHFYWKNEMFREKLQSEAVPWLLEQGIIKPNPYRVIEGADMLERANKAMDEMRKGVSGEKLVWRIAEE